MKNSLPQLTLFTSLVLSNYCQANIDYLDTGNSIQVADTEHYKNPHVVWRQNADSSYQFNLYAKRFWCRSKNKSSLGCLTKSNQPSVSIPVNYLMVDQLVENLNTEDYYEISADNADQLVTKLWEGHRHQKLFRALTAPKYNLVPNDEATSTYHAADLGLPEDLFAAALPMLENQSSSAHLFTTKDYDTLQKIQAHALRLINPDQSNAAMVQTYISSIILFGKLVLKGTSELEKLLLVAHPPTDRCLQILLSLEGFYRLYWHSFSPISPQQQSLISVHASAKDASMMFNQMQEIHARLTQVRLEQLRLQESGSEAEIALIQRLKQANDFDRLPFIENLFGRRIDPHAVQSFQALLNQDLSRWAIVLADPKLIQMGDHYKDNLPLWAMLDIAALSDTEKDQVLQKVDAYHVVEMILYEADLASLEQILQANTLDALFKLNQDALFSADDARVFLKVLQAIKLQIDRNSPYSWILQAFYDEVEHVMKSYVGDLVSALKKQAATLRHDAEKQHQVLSKALLLEQTFLNYNPNAELNPINPFTAQ